MGRISQSIRGTNTPHGWFHPSSGGGGTNIPPTMPQTNGSYASLVQAESLAFQNAQQQIKVAIEVQGGDAVTELMRYKIIEASSSGSGVNWSQTVGAYDR